MRDNNQPLGEILYLDPHVKTADIRRGLVIDIVRATKGDEVVVGPFIVAVEDPEKFKVVFDDEVEMYSAVECYRNRTVHNYTGLKIVELHDLPETNREFWENEIKLHMHRSSKSVER